MTDETKLLPCPFCGGRATIRSDGDHSTAYWVGCNTDGCLGRDHWEEDYAGAIAAWNTRAATDAREKALEDALRGMMNREARLALQGNEHKPLWEASHEWITSYNALAASQPADPVTNAICRQPVRVNADSQSDYKVIE